MALMIKNPTKHTISGSMTDLWPVYRDSLCGATSQAVSTYVGEPGGAKLLPKMKDQYDKIVAKPLARMHG